MAGDDYDNGNKHDDFTSSVITGAQALSHTPHSLLMLPLCTNVGVYILFVC